MLSIAFGLLLYHILIGILSLMFTIVIIIVALSGLGNVFNGHGLWYNFCEIWASLVHALRLITEKRNDTR